MNPNPAAMAFNWLNGYMRMLLRSTITKGKADEIERVIRYALATRERRLDVGFMVLNDCAPGLRAMAVTDDMARDALEEFIDSLRLLVIERTTPDSALDEPA